MKNWHLIAIIIAVYIIGVKWPSPGQMVLSKVGL